MLLTSRPEPCRHVEVFDLITPKGRIVRFSPGENRRLWSLLTAHAGDILVSASVIGLVLWAGFLAEGLGLARPETCPD